MFVRIVIPWSARIWAGLAGIIWGVFLVGHLKDWVFFPESGEALPQFVIWTLILHGLMILGLFGTVFRIRMMAAVAVVCAAGFFLGVIGARGIVFFLATIPPSVYVLATKSDSPAKIDKS